MREFITRDHFVRWKGLLPLQFLYSYEANMRKTHFGVALIFLTASFLFSGCQSSPRRAGETPEILAEFEYEVLSDMKDISLPVKFKGEEYQFVIDTGSTDTVFDDSFKDKLGKRFLWPKKGTGAGGKKIKVEYFHVPDAYLGPFNLKHHTGPLITVTDLDRLIPDEKRTYQGIIGMDFLDKYVVRIDFDNKKVTFFKAEKDVDMFFFLRPKENRHPEWGEPIQLKTKLFSNLRYINAQLSDNISADFLVDSGWAAQSALSSSLFEKIHPDVTIGPKSENTSPNITLFSNLNAKLIERFSVGSFEYKDQLFQKKNQSILGLPFLSRHSVTFDFPNNVMYLKRGKDFHKQSLIYHIKGLFKLSAEDFTVLEVDPDGPAYGRIREKDILVRINDRNVSSLSVVGWVKFLSQLSVPKGGELTFNFKRGDKMVTIAVSKHDLDASEN